VLLKLILLNIYRAPLSQYWLVRGAFSMEAPGGKEIV